MEGPVDPGVPARILGEMDPKARFPVDPGVEMLRLILQWIYEQSFQWIQGVGLQ